MLKRVLERRVLHRYTDGGRD